MNLKINKKSVFLLLIFIWIAFSLWYIANDQWQDFKMKENQQAYQLGRSDTVKAVIDEVSKCQQLPLTIDDKKATIISVECLQQKNPTQTPQTIPNTIENQQK